MRNVEIVETIVRYHSSPKRTDLFIAGSASKIIGLHQDQEAVDLGDREAMVATEVRDLGDEIADRVKCLMRNVEIVETIVRYHSSPKRTDLFIAGSASKTTNSIDE